MISFLFALFLFIAYYTAMLLLHKSVTSQRFNSYISKRYVFGLVCVCVSFKYSFGTISPWNSDGNVYIWAKLLIAFYAMQIRIETAHVVPTRNAWLFIGSISHTQEKTNKISSSNSQGVRNEHLNFGHFSISCCHFGTIQLHNINLKFLTKLNEVWL